MLSAVVSVTPLSPHRESSSTESEYQSTLCRTQRSRSRIEDENKCTMHNAHNAHVRIHIPAHTALLQDPTRPHTLTAHSTLSALSSALSALSSHQATTGTHKIVHAFTTVR